MRRTIWPVIAGLVILGGFVFSADNANALKPGSQEAIGTIGTPGKEIDIERYRVPGKTTVFDFFSRNCPPCRALAPGLRRLAEGRPDIVVRTVNVDRPESRGIDFNSPVATQYGIRALPHFVIYDAEGHQTSYGRPAHQQVVDWIGQLPPPETPQPPVEEQPSRRRAADDYPAGSGGHEAGS